MIVAGFELTRTTLMPSSRRARQACDPEKSNSAACPIWIGPDPIRRTFLISVRFGMIRLILLKSASKKCASVSRGPPWASGWNWTVVRQRSSFSNPSTVPSLTFVYVTFEPSGRESASTANPWFWVVMKIRPSLNRTGWLAPRWPNFSLYVSPREQGRRPGCPCRSRRSASDRAGSGYR